MRVTRDLAQRMALDQADIDALLAEGEMEGYTDDSDGPDRHDGEANWVAYLPSCGRAVAVSNGDPVWYDADSLEDALIRWRSQDEDRLRN